MDAWYLDNLVCPRDYLSLSDKSGDLTCPNGHAYPVVDDTPVMLLDDEEQTMAIADASIKRAKGICLDTRAPHLYLESLGISEAEKDGIIKMSLDRKCDIDPVVTYICGATCGHSYKHLIGRLDSYPIPELRLPPGDGRTLLDIGCNWGRWSIAAYRKGYNVVGVDPSLGAIMAAKRVNKQLGLSIKYLVADARWLPFRNAVFDTVFSYSVLQHLSRNNVEKILSQVARVLKSQGKSLIQMANIYGFRSVLNQAKRRFKEPSGFEVRYWGARFLKSLFSTKIGKTDLDVDCYFGLGLQFSDISYMPTELKIVTYLSELLRKCSRYVPFLIYIADSIYLISVCDKR